MGKPLRSVIREFHFEKDLAELIGDFAEADDFVAGAEWLLAQNPEIGFRTGEGSAGKSGPRLWVRLRRGVSR